MMSQNEASGVAPGADVVFANGRLRPSNSNRRLPLINPATEEMLAIVTCGDSSDVDRAVRASNDALAEWSSTAPEVRAAVLRTLADLIDRETEPLARLVTTENGTPITLSHRMNGIGPARAYRHFATLAETQSFERTVATGMDHAHVVSEPVGVVGAIAAWNAPQSSIAWKVGAALAAGCTVVVKPAPETTLDAFEFARFTQLAGLPPGVVNVVAGDAETGAALVDHPLIDKISFTGSTAVGRQIARTCGERLRPVTLELGGKSALVVLDDLDPAVLHNSVLDLAMPNAGQICRSCTRLLLPRHRESEYLDAVLDALSRVTPGDPLDPLTEMGPLASRRARDRVEGYLAQGVADGARLRLGGTRSREKPRGFFIDPTVFDMVDNSMRIAREEIFGPVLCVMTYDADDDAVALANDSEYGLGGCVLGDDEQRSLGIARRMKSGTVGVQRYKIELEAPFGGLKASGLGRELGPDALDAYLTMKTIYRVGPVPAVA